MNSPKLVWLDLETTGLKPQDDEILEIGIVITGSDLKPLAQYHQVIHPFYDTFSDFITEMHTPNGLLTECAWSKVGYKEAAQAAKAFLEKHLGDSEAYLAGNSVHFDRGFLARWMPGLLEYVSNRHFDVSTFKVAAAMFMPNFPWVGPASVHRVLPDIQRSMDEFRMWQEWFFSEPGVLDGALL